MELKLTVKCKKLGKEIFSSLAVECIFQGITLLTNTLGSLL